MAAAKTITVKLTKVGESKNCDIYAPDGTQAGYYGKLYIPKNAAQSAGLNGSASASIGATK
jgi:hypothetical protein